MRFPIYILCCSLYFLCVQAQITVYRQLPLADTIGLNASNTVSGGSAAATPTVQAAYDQTQLTPPPVPSPPVGSPNYTLVLQSNPAGTGGSGPVQGLSIPHVGGSFWGFSLEMSILSQVLGKNSTFLQVPFLNLMSQLQARSGGVVIRIGGNTQEFATLVPSSSLSKGKTFGKEVSGTNQTTNTPAVLYTQDMFYMASNISSMLNVKWFFGIPFNDSVNWRLEIAEQAETILGENLLGLQAGNEPDFYVQFGRRAVYSPELYIQDVQSVLSAMTADPKIPIRNNLIGPNIATGNWTPEMVWDAGFITTFKDQLFALAVEHYPNNNCAIYGANETIINPQDIFSTYLTHTGVVTLVQPYINSTVVAQQQGPGIPFYMFETNTASCGGFAGISDSYGAALWAIDYGFQLAWANFTHGLLHTGGQNAYYNPFTAPPTNQSTFKEWTVGSIFYSAIVLAEAFGTANTSQIVDLGGNNGSIYTPSYAIYEGGSLSRVALLNYIDDPTGANALTVTIQVQGATISSVGVKYLAAASVSVRDNITWAGQTFGGEFTVDGTLKGQLNVSTVSCTSATDPTTNILSSSCIVPVPAPGFALVFLPGASNAQQPQLSIGQATKTFATTAYTKLHNTATVDPSVLATSNGHSGMDKDEGFGSTSVKSVNSGMRMTSDVFGLLLLGTLLVFRRLL